MISKPVLAALVPSVNVYIQMKDQLELEIKSTRTRNIHPISYSFKDQCYRKEGSYSLYFYS